MSFLKCRLFGSSQKARKTGASGTSPLPHGSRHHLGRAPLTLPSQDTFPDPRAEQPAPLPWLCVSQPVGPCWVSQGEASATPLSLSWGALLPPLACPLATYPRGSPLTPVPLDLAPACCPGPLPSLVRVTLRVVLPQPPKSPLLGCRPVLPSALTPSCGPPDPASTSLFPHVSS